MSLIPPNCGHFHPETMKMNPVYPGTMEYELVQDQDTDRYILTSGVSYDVSDGDGAVKSYPGLVILPSCAHLETGGHLRSVPRNRTCVPTNRKCVVINSRGL